MTVNRGLWVPINTGNVGTTEIEARLADNALFESNNGFDARSGLLAPQSSTVVTGQANMSYNIIPIDPVINRVTNEGVYRFTTTGTTNVPTTAAPTANSRIDVIWVKQNDQSKGDANNLAVAGVTQGATAASPVAPAIPAGALELARATVGPNITATTAASITQTFRYAALVGTPVPVRDAATERAEITAPRIGQQVARLDLDPTGRVTEFRTAAGWLSRVAHAEFTSATNLVPPNAEWGMGTITRDTAAGGYESTAGTDNAWVTVPATDTLQVRDTGIYDITTAILFDAVPTGVVWSNTGVPGVYAPGIGGLQYLTSAVSNVRLAAGALIKPTVAHGSATNKNITSRIRVTRKG